MAYILAEQRDQGTTGAVRQAFKRYEDFLRAHGDRFPPAAWKLATSDWYYGFSDHRAPHDAWLIRASFEEHPSSEVNSERFLSLRTILLGSYGDLQIEFFYPIVYAYSLSNPNSTGGHFDWRYDEFRLSPAGHLIHEIEWAGGPGFEARWLIEASDVEFSAHAVGI